MTTIEERARELHAVGCYPNCKKDIGSKWLKIAKFSLIKEIEARIDEIYMNMTCDSERLNNKRIADLTAQKAKLEET